MKRSLLKVTCILACLFVFSCSSSTKTAREPNQVTDVGGDKSFTGTGFDALVKSTPVSKVESSNLSQYQPLNKNELQSIEWDSLSQAQSFGEYTIYDFSNGYACNDFGASTTLIKYAGNYYNIGHGDSCVKNIQFNSQENTVSFSTFHYARAKAALDGKASATRIQHNIYLNMSSRVPNQVTNVGGGKTSLLDMKLFFAMADSAEMSETSRRINYRIYNVYCSHVDKCSFTGLNGKRIRISGNRAHNISTNIGIERKVAMLTCSNWFEGGVDGKELPPNEASQVGLITCESE